MHIHVKKLINAVLFSALLLSCPSLSAYAEEGKPIGNFSPEMTYESETADAETVRSKAETLVTLSDGVTYDSGSDLFYREVEGSLVGANIPDGAIVTGTVTFELSPSLTGILYRNGTAVDGADLTEITHPGKYILSVSANEIAQPTRIGFTIVSSPTGEIKEYKMPADFFVISATLNGEPASYRQTYVDMTSDGDYEISYRSPEANKDMMLSVTIDHTAPTATLTGIVDGKANEPVTVSNVEEGATVYLIRNGKQVPFTGTISETGSYTLTVKDQAGNETDYSFVIVTYANSSLKILIGSAIILALALIGYLIYYRKYIRVS